MSARVALATALGLTLGLTLVDRRLTTGAAAAAPTGATSAGTVVRVEHRDPTTAPTRGPANALVTIELFLVPAPNPGSRLAVYRAIERLQAAHPARVRLIYRVVRSGSYHQLPNAALEAHAQGRFAEFIDALHTNRTSTALTKDQILEVGRKVGMDGPRLAAALSDGRYNDVLAANDRRFVRLKGGTVPNVLFNSQAPRSPFTGLSEADLEREYQAAYERARDLIDQGHDARALTRAFDDQARRGAPFVLSIGSSSEEDLEGASTDHKLASPPLDLTGLPSFGRPDAPAAVPMVVLCRPNESACGGTLRITRRLQEIYTDEVRVVWAPWFDVTRDDAADLTMLGDAALCAEQVASSPELNASPGWSWISKQLDHAARSHGRRLTAEKLIDIVANELDVDSKRLSACRARMANTTLDWIAAARRSGVTRSPAIVIGGRIYEGLSDQTTIQRLIEAELSPGVLGDAAESQFDRLLFLLTSPTAPK